MWSAPVHNTPLVLIGLKVTPGKKAISLLFGLILLKDLSIIYRREIWTMQNMSLDRANTSKIKIENLSLGSWRTELSSALADYIWGGLSGFKILNS